MKQGRNQPCLCGSGKKYKHCCLSRHVMESEKTKNIYEEEDDFSDDEEYDNFPEDEKDENARTLAILQKMMHKMHEWRLNRLPHIKQYKKLRKLHSEVMTSMANYLEEGKFEHKIDVEAGIAASEALRKQKIITEPRTIRITSVSYDFNTYEGEQAYYDFHIYKTAPNANSITEEFIQSRRYRKPEKVALLEAMHNSVRGLFEVVETDSDQGYVYLKEVFTGEVFKIIDIGMSVHDANTDMYFYRRIITVGEISMGAGVTLAFDKNDKFIKNFIERERVNYHPYGEMVRFNDLYNRYTTSSVRIETRHHEIK